MYYTAEDSAGTLWATVMLGFGLVAMTMDNVLRPILMNRGGHLPLPLIMAGALGGVITFGLLGIFLGPAILAVAYTLLNAWMDEAAPSDPDPPG